jgi:hypothetical protein
METGRLCRLFVASVVTLVTMLTGVYVIMQVMKYVLHLYIYINRLFIDVNRLMLRLMQVIKY